MTTLTAEQAVEAGAAWLDLTYPGWYRSIDLGILDVGKCDVCVLGQVYTGCIPEGERGEILAQVRETVQVMWTPYGYNILVALHRLSITEIEAMGFVRLVSITCECVDDCTCSPTFAELTDAWTRLIIQRRLNDHPDVRMEHSTLNAIEPERAAA